MKPKSMRRLRVSRPRLDLACIDRPNSLIKVLSGGWLVATQAPAKVLDIDRAHLLTCRDGELVAVNDDANRNAVHFGNAAGDRLRAQRPRVSQVERQSLWQTLGRRHRRGRVAGADPYEFLLHGA